MTRTRWLVLAQLALVAACASGPRPLPCSPLASKVAEELRRDAPRAAEPGSPLAAVGDRHVLFVGGFLNELIPGYFDDNAAVAEELGARTSRLFPSSAAGLDEDAALIRDEALARHAESRRAVLLVGHSKGGAAALLAALRYPELVLTGVVDRVVVIQGAIGGSPLAAAIAGSAPLRLLPFRWRGLESLRVEDSRRLFRQALASARARLTSDGLQRLLDRVFYVRTWERRGGASLELALTHEYLRRFGSGQSDGLLLQEDMLLDGAGVDLGVLAGDHAALTVSGLLSNSAPAERRAFTRALFREIYGPRPGRWPVEVAGGGHGGRGAAATPLGPPGTDVDG